MRIICLVHVPFEDAANIQSWAESRGYILRHVALYKQEILPEMEEFDFLAIMGGTMNIYEHDDHPWLIEEKQFIGRAIKAGKKVLGVCLGGQLIADVLGGKVTKNRYPEIGWHTIQLTPFAKKLPLMEGFADELTVFQWHGDTFSIPPGADHLASSVACANEAFLYGSDVLGLQFHLEYSRESIEDMLVDCSHELVQSPYVQNEKQIRQSLHMVPTIKEHLFSLLDRFISL